MRSRLRWLLPLIQVVFAVTLTMSNLSRRDSMSNPSWTAPDRQLCDGLNAPAAVLRFLLSKALDSVLSSHPVIQFVLEIILYFWLVALLWYVVSIEAVGWKTVKSSSVTRKVKARTWVDLMIVFLGIGVVFAGELVRHQFGYVSVYSNLISVPYFVWGLILMGFYGNDIWSSIQGSIQHGGEQ